jgi:phosphohistidine swiveling domain-containing protein
MATPTRTRTGPEAVGAPVYVLPFERLDRSSLAAAGGKAANLGEMTRAGLPVPPGFCVTTAAYERVAAGADLGSVLSALEAVRPDDHARLEALAGAARAALVAAPVPAEIAQAVLVAYRALGDDSPVAVRSSATAEDLPNASFAGQQDTFLNVVGEAPLLDAVRRCWASLWTDRAVSYRRSNRIDQRAVRLAVAVQRMVDAHAAAVMFTANPLTGRRGETVIDASPGLGEAIVSGAVNPDHFVVDTASGRILERRLGDKRLAVRPTAGGGTERVELGAAPDRACLTDEQLRALAELGARVEAHYGAPQDTEIAVEADGRIWLTQARPITTLFPLPEGAPPPGSGTRLYFSFNVAQGVFRPLTPMGIQAFRLVGSAIAGALGQSAADRYRGPAALVEAGHRLFFDVTPVVRSRLGRALFLRGTAQMEARSSAALLRLGDDPRLTPTSTPVWRDALRVAPAVARTRVPPRVLRALLDPAAARERLERAARVALARADLPAEAPASARLDALERLFLEGIPRVAFNAFPVLAVGLGSLALASRLLGDLASEEERQAIRRGLPHNPTTEMDLALWRLAERARADDASRAALTGSASEQLAAQYRAGALPPRLQDGLAAFLAHYGHRGVAEIDLGLPRWSEDPTHVLGVLTNYLAHTDPEQAPDRQFRRVAAAAEATVAELTRRASARSRVRGRLVGFALGRMRALAGAREAPKFHLVALFARARALLWPVGAELARADRLQTAEDVFFATLPELRAALAGADLRPAVRERRASYDRELRRRHIPRLLLSDGTEPTSEDADAAEDSTAIRGTPASTGTVTARARVVLDPTGARIEPGEILVAPSTDPGWTPLFLTAGGLVMEMGGSMSHGAVVAREYGIPAVVGVASATERIRTGQLVRVDGAAGVVYLAPGSG